MKTNFYFLPRGKRCTSDSSLLLNHNHLLPAADCDRGRRRAILQTRDRDAPIQTEKTKSVSVSVVVMRPLRFRKAAEFGIV